MVQIKQESLFIKLDDSQTLHLRHIYNPDRPGPAVFFMHGAIENGKIFYTHSNKGLAPFLAEQGYDCYVADLRGRGESKPLIGPHAEYGQTEAIVEDIPAFIEKIRSQAGHFPAYWVAHSWGGVLMNACFARNPDWIDKVRACVYFGSKRSLYNRHPAKLIKGDIMWQWLAPKLAKKHGYLPAKERKWGSDNETVKSHAESVAWVKKGPWVDPDDGFDYGSVLRDLSLPPILHIAGVKDKALAQPIDIQKFIEESGTGTQQLNIYGRKRGHGHNYGHIDMLTHPNAHKDQFQDLLDWFSLHSSTPA